VGRKKGGFVEELGRLPWPVGIILGVVLYVVVSRGIPAWLARSQSPALQLAGQQLTMHNSLDTLALVAMAVCWIGAISSFLRARRRARLLDMQASIDSIAALSWREFEQLVGEAYRREGFTVEETGQGGADGGIDLTLRRAGALYLVQCKQWRKRQVSVNIVREMVGLLHHHDASKVIIVCVGHFTRDAEAFARDKPVELVTGAQLLELVRRGQARSTQTPERPSARVEPTLSMPPIRPDPPPPTLPECPRCKGPMIQRANRKTGAAFLGCAAFPTCRGMRSLKQA
jgi:restriction system protein